MRKIVANLLLSVTGIFIQYLAGAQGIGIGTINPSSSAILDITSSSKGVLIPRVNLTSVTDAGTILNPATSLLVYNTNSALATGAGYYYNSGTPASPSWSKILTNTTAGWSLSGNSGTDASINFIGTTDQRPLKLRVNNLPAGSIDNSTYNTHFGYESGAATFGNVTENTGFGYNTLQFAGAYRSTAIGAFALANNQQFGYYNTAIGARSMNSNTTGAGNTAVGVSTLFSNLTGTRNVAIGDSAMYGNTNSSFNIGIGVNALKSNSNSNTIGIGRLALENNAANYNIAIGDQSLRANVTGFSNIAVGTSTLNDNTSGSRNTAIGHYALRDNTTGEQNTAVGTSAMASRVLSSFNTAIGYNAMGSNGSSYATNNVAIGPNALRSIDGADNIAIGNNAMADAGFASNNIAIGSNAMESITYSASGLPWASDNIAIGKYAMQETRPTSTTNGYKNVAVGAYALRANITGISNLAIGHEALKSSTAVNSNIAIGTLAMGEGNVTGVLNLAVGIQSLLFNESGNNNTSIGHNGLRLNTTGYSNTVLGGTAMYNNTVGNFNTAIGNEAGAFNNANSYCSFLGYDADQTTGSNYSNSTAIGATSRITASNQVRIGASSVSSIGGYAAWSNLSDGRFKTNITESVKGLDFIMALRPVTYNIDVNSLAAYLKEDVSKDSTGKIINRAADPQVQQQRAQQSAVLQTGFIAQEVDAAAQKLGYEFSGVDKPKNADDLYALRYSEFVVPLVKAVQEQQKEIAELKQLLLQTQKALVELKERK
ncbi:MAG: tail fiber domain-containing protein [Rhizobacter sp.]|nr:tail fiber domain-containing protein [Ferruginibacter sp.]